MCPHASRITHSEDYRRAKAIVAGSEVERALFEDEYNDDVVRAALRLCEPGCSDHADCPVNPRWPETFPRREQRVEETCEELLDARSFIFRTLYTKCLPAYQGRCALRTFLFPVLHAIRPRVSETEGEPGSRGPGYNHVRLLADYLREKYGRFRATKGVKELGRRAEAIAVSLWYGRSDVEIAVLLGLTPDLAGTAQLCREKEWLWNSLSATDREALLSQIERGPGNRPLTFTELALGDEPDQPDDFDVADPVTTEPDPDPRGLQELAIQALTRLDARDRALLRRRFFEGWEYKEIAAEEGTTVGAVYVRVLSALGRLRAAALALGGDDSE